MDVYDSISKTLDDNLWNFLQETCKHYEINSAFFQDVSSVYPNSASVAKLLGSSHHGRDARFPRPSNCFALMIGNHQSDFRFEKSIFVLFYYIKKVCASARHKYRKFHSSKIYQRSGQIAINFLKNQLFSFWRDFSTFEAQG